MGNLNDPADWWNVTALKNARLKITAGSAADVTVPMVIVTQQARSY